MDDSSIAYGCIILFLSNILCSSGGVGGGSLNVPILYTIMKFDYETSTLLSLCNLMGNYLLQLLVNIEKRHPSPLAVNRPLIYWDAVLILLPSELGGAAIGTIISKAMPPSMIFILGMIVLVIACIFTFQKASRMYHDESEILEITTEVAAASENTCATITTTTGDEVMSKSLLHGGRVRCYANKVVKISSIIPPYFYCYYKGKSSDHDYEESTTESLPPINYPRNVITVVVSVWILYVICYVVLNLYKVCAQNYTIVLIVIYCLLVFQVVWGIKYLQMKQKNKPERMVEGDIAWSERTLFLPLIAFLVGITCTLLGIGGGELMSPLMIAMGVLPPVSSATSSLMSFMNSSSIVSHHIVVGDLPYKYGAIVFFIGCFGGFSGRVLALYFVALYSRASILLFSLGTVLFCAFFIYLLYLVYGDIDFSLKTIC